MIRSWRRALRQADRDIQSRAIVEAVAAGRAVEPFVLFLRPFDTLQRLTAQGRAPRLGGYTDHVDYEEVLVAAFDGWMPVVAVGEALDQDRLSTSFAGVGRATTTAESWKVVVARLVAEASIILVVPFANEGTQWEIERVVRSGAIERTVLIMPETALTLRDDLEAELAGVHHFMKGFHVQLDRLSDHGLDARSAWTEAMSATAQRAGLQLPNFSDSGAMFSLAHERLAIAPLSLKLVNDRASYVRLVLAGILSSQGVSCGQPEAPSPLVNLQQHLPSRSETALLLVALHFDAWLTWGRYEGAGDCLYLWILGSGGLTPDIRDVLLSVRKEARLQLPAAEQDRLFTALTVVFEALGLDAQGLLP